MQQFSLWMFYQEKAFDGDVDAAAKFLLKVLKCEIVFFNSENRVLINYNY